MKKSLLALLGASVLVVGALGSWMYLLPTEGVTVTARPIDMGDPRLAALTGAEIPAPTEIAEWKADRKDRRRLRQEWIEELHRCPPGIDWSAIEAANRRALSLERFAALERGERTDQWAELGSVNLAGRTHAACPSGDGQHLYVGSDRGGIWRGTIDGEDWIALSDGLGLGSHQLIVIPAGAGPDEPEILFTMTSETVFASADEGTTWFVPPGLPDNVYNARRIVHDRAHPRTVYLLSRGRIVEPYTYGFILSRSTDGGLTFETRYVFPALPNCDMWIDRVAGGDLYVISGNVLYVSHDEGAAFIEIGTVPCTSLNNVLLTGSEAGAPTFYAAIREGTIWNLYRSINGGADWTFRYPINDFWETLVASIINPDIVFFAGVECYRSTNGGASFAKINNWYEYYGDPENKLHADLPGMDVHMIGGQEAIYFDTDGGTYVSHDGGATVQNLSLWGLAISQYYDIFTSATDPYLIAAGSQDQGYQQAILGGDARNGYLPFEQLISGDYGHLTSMARDHNWLYSVYPGFVLLQVQEEPPQGLYQIDFPNCSHSWMPPILADPRHEDVFYLCGDHIWRYARDYGYHFVMTELPNDFSVSGGYVSALAISPADYNYWYAVTSNGYLWYSHDAGLNWTMTDHGPTQHYFYGTALVCSPSNRDVAYVGGNGYAGHMVYQTTNGGENWTGMGNGIETLVYGLALGGIGGEDLFAACEAGPYEYDADAGEWVSILGTEAPLTTYWCVEWVPEIGVVRYGTYGRGIWDYAPVDYADVPSIAAAGERLDLTLSPNPAAERLSIRFRTATAGAVDLALFDVAGRKVADLARGEYAAGEHEVSLAIAGRGLEAGFYLARLSCADGVTAKKVQLVP